MNVSATNIAEEFDSVKNHVLPLYPKEYQKEQRKEVLEITAGDAVKKGIIASELQAYYLVLSEKFFEYLKRDKCSQKRYDALLTPKLLIITNFKG